MSQNLIIYSLIIKGSYGWSDGTVYDGTAFWEAGEPNDQENEKCVEMIHNTGTWNDIGCTTQQQGYACKAHRRKLWQELYEKESK